MWRTSRRMLRFHRRAFTGTFVAVLFGVAIVQACAGLVETGIRTAVAPQRYAAAPVVVVGERSVRLAEPEGDHYDAETVHLGQPVRLASDVTGRVSDVSGVARAVEDVAEPAAVLRDGEIVLPSVAARDWQSAQLAPYRLAEGRAPEPAGVAVDESIARALDARPGTRITLQAGGVAIESTIIGIVVGPPGSTAPPVFFSSSDFAAAFGAPAVTAVGVLLTDGADPDQVAGQLREALKGTGTEVLTGDDRGAAESPEVSAGASNMVALGSVIGSIAAIIVMFLVTAMTGVLLQDRRREIAMLRAVGAAPRQVRSMLLGETLAIAVAAGLLGCLIGSFTGRWLLRVLVDLRFAPEQLSYRQGWITALIALGVGVLSAGTAAGIGARRLVKAAPLDDLTEAAVPRRWFSWIRLLAALLSAGGGVALMIVTTTVTEGEYIAATAGPTFLLWAITVALLAPPLGQAIVRPLGLVVRSAAGFAGRLAMRNTKASPVRFAAVVTPIMLATSFVLGNYYLQTTVDASTLREHARNVLADFVLTSPTGAHAPGFPERIRAVPGVATAAEQVTTIGYVRDPYDSSQRDEGYVITGVDAAYATDVLKAPATAGSLGDLRGSTAALTVRHASRLDRSLGDTLRLMMDDGAELELRIVALFEAGRGADNILLPVELVAAHTPSGRPNQIVVRATPGADRVALAEALRDAARAQPGVVVASRSALTTQLEEQLRTSAAVNYLLLGLVAAYAVIAVVNTLATETLRRRREFALQRLVGAPSRQVLVMIAIEAALGAVVGLILGALVSLTTLVPLSLALADRLLPIGPVAPIPLLVVGMTLLTTATALTAGRLALRGRSTDALGSE